MKTPQRIASAGVPGGTGMDAQGAGKPFFFDRGRSMQG